MTIELGVIIALIGGVMSVATFFIGRQTAAKSEGEWKGELKMTLRHIQDSLKKLEDTTAKSVQATNDDLDAFKKEVKDSIRRIHERIDNISGTSPAD